MEQGKEFKELLMGTEEKKGGKLQEIGLSVYLFALECGLTRTAVYLYMAGKGLPSTTTLYRMAHVLGMEAEDLLKILPTREPGRQRGSKPVDRVF